MKRSPVRVLAGLAVILLYATIPTAALMLLLGYVRRSWWRKLGAIRQSGHPLKWLFTSRPAVAAEMVTYGNFRGAWEWLTTGKVTSGRKLSGNRGVKAAQEQVNQAQEEGAQLVALDENGKRIPVPMPGGPNDYLSWLEQVSTGRLTPGNPGCAALARTLYEKEAKHFARQLEGKGRDVIRWLTRERATRRALRVKLAECLTGLNLHMPWLDALEQWGRAAAEIAITVGTGPGGRAGEGGAVPQTDGNR